MPDLRQQRAGKPELLRQVWRKNIRWLFIIARIFGMRVWFNCAFFCLDHQRIEGGAGVRQGLLRHSAAVKRTAKKRRAEWTEWWTTRRRSRRARRSAPKKLAEASPPAGRRNASRRSGSCGR